MKSNPGDSSTKRKAEENKERSVKRSKAVEKEKGVKRSVDEWDDFAKKLKTTAEQREHELRRRHGHRPL